MEFEYFVESNSVDRNCITNNFSKKRARPESSSTVDEMEIQETDWKKSKTNHSLGSLKREKVSNQQFSALESLIETRNNSPNFSKRQLFAHDLATLSISEASLSLMPNFISFQRKHEEPAIHPNTPVQYYKMETQQEDDFLMSVDQLIERDENYFPIVESSFKM